VKRAPAEKWGKVVRVLSRLTLPRFAALVWCAAACTDAGLQPYQPGSAAVLDNKLEVDATVCTDPPADSVFPVKILFVIDNSDSMNVTDPGRLRGQGVLDVINRFSGDPAVFFDIITFGTHIQTLKGGFSNSPNTSDFTDAITVSDGTTDYQGALGTAFDVLSQDMAAAGPGLNPRTKYVIIWFSDGFPDPECIPGQISPYVVCSQPRDEWPPGTQDLFPGILSVGQAYNTPAQITQSVSTIMGLQTAYHVGDMQFNTLLLTDPANFGAPIANAFGITPASTAIARTLLQQMSPVPGYGTYTEFSSADQISFLNFNYTSLPDPDALALFYANNVSTVLSGTEQVVDTDNDGLADSEENTLKTCVGLGQAGVCSVASDTDGDGYSDWFENLERNAGFDPKDPKKPVQPCTDRGDDDGDGLKNCEEAYSGTDPRLFDSDADLIPDSTELRNGLDPLNPADAKSSAANDGIRNLDAIRVHKNPRVPDPALTTANIHYLYQVQPAPTTADARTCYSVSASNIELMTTGKGTNSPRGVNHVILSFIESPTNLTQAAGVLKVACVTVRYVDGEVKEPENGKVTLSPSDFHPADATHSLSGFNQADCVDVTKLKKGS